MVWLGAARALRVLHVNKFLYRRGGAESYMFDVAALQQNRGHHVDFWGMSHPENNPCTYSKQFVDEADFGDRPASLGEQLRLLGRMVYSRQARKRLEAVLSDFRPDVIHAHNIYHQLSPSILQAANAVGVPIVLTMHDYKLVCPSYQLLADGKVCERCVTGGVHNAIQQRCNRNSLGASTAVAIESGIHRATSAYAKATTLIAPSRFMADIVGRSARYTQPLLHIPHFTELDRKQAAPDSSAQVLFAGRLSSEKGIDVLIAAAQLLAERSIAVNVVIAGDGPDAERLTRAATGLANIRFTGRLDKAGIDQLLASSALLVAPSTWHENQPMIILEAIAAGLPVVASDLGGMSELVRDGETGRLVPPGNAEALATAVADIMSDTQARAAMGRAGRELAAAHFGAEQHLDSLDAAYTEAAVAVNA